MTNGESHLKSTNQNAPAFPVGLCIASVATTSLGLVAAALGVKWGAAPAPGDALRDAWAYVQVMLALMWLVVWPAMRSNGSGKALAFEAVALAMGAVPALVMAATLSGIGPSMLGVFVLGQLACGLAAMGVLAVSLRHRVVAMFLPVLALAGPVVAFVWSDFLHVP